MKFNRPEKRNAMSPALNRRMMEVFDELEFNDDVGVLVLAAKAPPGTAGMDLKEYFRETESQGLRGIRKSQRESYGWFHRLRWFQEADHRHGQWQVLWRRLWPAFFLRSGDLRRRSPVRPQRNQLGHPARRRRHQGGVVELLSFRDAMYHAMTGELIDGKKAAAWKLVNESVPLAQLEGRVRELVEVLLKKNPVALKFTKDAVRRVSEMTYDNAHGLSGAPCRKRPNFHDKTEGRKEGMRQFLDEKSYKPGLGAYDNTRKK